VTRRKTRALGGNCPAHGGGEGFSKSVLIKGPEKENNGRGRERSTDSLPLCGIKGSLVGGGGRVLLTGRPRLKGQRGEKENATRGSQKNCTP